MLVIRVQDAGLALPEEQALADLETWEELDGAVYAEYEKQAAKA